MWMNPVPPRHSAAKVMATVRLSRYKSCEEVGWRRVVIIKHCRHLECLSSFLLYRIVLLGAHDAQEVGAEPSVAGSNHLLAHLTMVTVSCLFGKMVVSPGVVISSLSSIFLSYCNFFHNYLGSSTDRATSGQSLPAKLSRGSLCGAVGSRCCAATWCGPVLREASWARAGPSCRAVWIAQCCDPGSTPWGTPGTETDN